MLITTTSVLPAQHNLKMASYPSLFTISTIKYSNKEHYILGRANTGPFENDLFQIRIKQLPEYENHKNAEECIVVSDNNGGCYKIAIQFGHVGENAYKNYKPEYYSDDFDCSEYDIPHYVWAIVTGMIVATI